MAETEPSGACGECVGACCRASVIIGLDAEEATTLRAVGTVLEELLPASDEANWGNRAYFRGHAPDNRKFLKKQARSLKAGKGLFGLESDCGFLEETDTGEFVCGVHEDPELKPDICESFTAGSRACREIQANVITDLVVQEAPILKLADIALGREVLRTLEGF